MALNIINKTQIQHFSKHLNETPHVVQIKSNVILKRFTSTLRRLNISISTSINEQNHFEIQRFSIYPTYSRYSRQQVNSLSPHGGEDACLYLSLISDPVTLNDVQKYVMSNQICSIAQAPVLISGSI